MAGPVAPEVPAATETPADPPRQKLNKNLTLAEQVAVLQAKVQANEPIIAAEAAAAAATLPTTPEGEAPAEPEMVVSEALMQPSKWPALVRAYSLVFKWGLIAMTLLGIGLYFMKTVLIPVTEELRNPGKKNVLKDKNASTAVRAIQATREVVKANDVNVEYLNAIIAADEGKLDVAATKGAKPVEKPVEAPVAVVAPTPTTYREAVDRMKISGVFEGDEIRVYVDGRVVKVGDIVDRTFGIRFIGIDPVQRTLLFSTMENTTLKRYY